MYSRLLRRVQPRHERIGTGVEIEDGNWTTIRLFVSPPPAVGGRASLSILFSNQGVSEGISVS